MAQPLVAVPPHRRQHQQSIGARQESPTQIESTPKERTQNPPRPTDICIQPPTDLNGKKSKEFKLPTISSQQLAHSMPPHHSSIQGRKGRKTIVEWDQQHHNPGGATQNKLLRIAGLAEIMRLLINRHRQQKPRKTEIHRSCFGTVSCSMYSCTRQYCIYGGISTYGDMYSK